MKVNVKKSRTKLPAGTMKEIAKRLNVSVSTVSVVLRGKDNSPRKAEILQAAAEYLEVYKTKEREAKAAFQRVLEAQV